MRDDAKYLVAGQSAREYRRRAGLRRGDRNGVREVAPPKPQVRLVVLRTDARRRVCIESLAHQLGGDALSGIQPAGSTTRPPVRRQVESSIRTMRA